MRETTFTQLCKHARDYFDAVEEGETVRVFRKGKAIAEIIPVRKGIPSWKRPITRLTFKNVVLSEEIVRDRGCVM